MPNLWNALLVCSVVACHAYAAGDGALLLKEDYESRLDVPLTVSYATGKNTVVARGVVDEKAYTGRHCAKVEVSHVKGFGAYLSPRTKDRPRVEWGRLGGIGGFAVDGLSIPLRPDRGYLLKLSVWVGQASGRNPARIAVRTSSPSPYGTVTMETLLPAVLAEPTKGWIEVEQELTSWLPGQLKARGYNTTPLRLEAIILKAFSSGGPLPLLVWVDDITLREVGTDVVREWADRARRAHERRRKETPFRAYPDVENQFIWGVYGGLMTPGPAWYAFDRSKPLAQQRTQQRELVERYADWMLLDLRRHYCDFIMGGGGMLFTGAPDEAFDALRARLDKCAEYGVRLGPSTYVTQHYRHAQSRAQCTADMKRLAAEFGDHPALLAYLLVDEPGVAGAEDFYWGKRKLESFDSNHPAISLCNSVEAIAEYAPVLPIVGIDLYTIRPQPSRDEGCWALADGVRFASQLGARRIWVLPQTFGATGSWRAATVEEFRVQIFSCLAEGVTGFLPFVYGMPPGWRRKVAFRGTLVDPYGNPSPIWDEMRRLGPFVRSVGPLLAEATPAPDGAATVRTRGTIVSNIGRKRPCADARVWLDAKRGVRYVTAFSNALRYRTSCRVTLHPADTELQVMDLFALRPTPVQGGSFYAPLGPGEGRVYAAGPAAKVKAVEAEVLRRRFGLERSLLELELRAAKRMGVNIDRCRTALSKAHAQFAAGSARDALIALHAARSILEDAKQSNVPFARTHAAIEKSRRLLGRVDQWLNETVVLRPREFPKTDATTKGILDGMVALSGRFFAVQSVFMRQGPATLGERPADLADEIEQFEQAARVSLGR